MRTRMTAERAGRLLLLAALLLGVLTMHSLGHPTGDHSGTHTAGPLTAAAAAGPAPGGGAAPLAQPAARTVQAVQAGTTPPQAEAGHPVPGAHEPRPAAALDAHSPAAGAGTGAADEPAPLPGTDPLSVCLAVLAALTLGLLLRAGGLLPRGTALGAALRVLLTGRRGPQWPIAPPTRLSLARLSVLRI
ncbi:hypothetical protein ACFWMQ_25065 [Streptomyces sp. NPDC058372]|uniref:hypothetical protein n=1 Tax=Streptomyces sp. NPDC058372 TaxID=3346464 RepID=UPI003662EAF4